MPPHTLKLQSDGPDAISIACGDVELLRYVFSPGTDCAESPRPYAHPLRTLAGDTLTNLRPNDHPWHHGLSLTLTSVHCDQDGPTGNPVNFWGGPTHAAADGYKWRSDHGTQRHREWIQYSSDTPDTLAHTLDWIDLANDRVLLRETRTLRIALIGSGGTGVSPVGLENFPQNTGETPVPLNPHGRDAHATQPSPSGWSLRWTSELKNVSGGTLTLGNYHAINGLAGSHYTGLQFRGARELLDDHGDTAINIHADGGLTGEKAVHGAASAWMEWHAQHDGTGNRTRIRFENLTGPIPWFVRRHNPLAAFSFHREHPHILTPDGALLLDHRLSFV